MPKGFVFKARNSGGELLALEEFEKKLSDFLIKNPQRTFVWLLRESSSNENMLSVSIAYRPSFDSAIELRHIRFLYSSENGWQLHSNGFDKRKIAIANANISKFLLDPLLQLLSYIGCISTRQLKIHENEINWDYRPSLSANTSALVVGVKNSQLDSNIALRPSKGSTLLDFFKQGYSAYCNDKGRKLLEPLNMEDDEIKEMCAEITQFIMNASEEITAQNAKIAYRNRLIIYLKNHCDFLDLDSLLCEELVCPITLQPLEDPVITPDGVTYSRASIEQWLSEKQIEPTTKSKLSLNDLISNTVILELIQKIKEVNLAIDLKKRQQQLVFKPS